MVKLDKNLKSKVDILLKAEDKEYNEWLNEKHEEYIKKHEKKIWEYAKKAMDQGQKLKGNKENLEKESIGDNTYYEKENY